MTAMSQHRSGRLADRLVRRPLSTQGLQPSHAPPALIPPSQKAPATKGIGTTHKGLRRIQKQPRPNSTSQTKMKIATAQPGAISPEARKNGARPSIAASANPATTYLAIV